MIKAFIIVCALSVVAYSLWERRGTWVCKWEKCTTCTVALMGASILLTNPLFDVTIGRYLWRTIGFRDTENIAGHALLILASVGIMHTATSRYMHEDERRPLLNKWVHYPALAAILSLLVPAALAGVDSSVLDGGPWTSTYWIIESSILAYLLGFAALIFNRLRDEPRHRRIAELYLAACVCGILACLARIAPLMLPKLDFPGPAAFQLMVLALKYSWIAVFAYTAAKSWRRRTRYFVPEPAAVG